MLEEIDVPGYKIKIKYATLEHDHGQYDGDSRTIVLNPSESNNLESCLFHECCHAILDIGGVNQILGPKLEEAVVRAMENGLWPLIATHSFDTENVHGRQKKKGRRGNAKKL